ncbi:ExbD/TolR family protein [Undibacterium sp. RTI2.1]|uniref:ExbD/TolR family protein n=1 Tax=unclassified Undibacterium TaxID=2630295 RepID=UPI002AB4CE1C|nr:MULTISPECIES: ExbD/TolR family protein [unclassified Undibacterium]MDY7538921.1 ExbD/TolR family protein [Undibacterium sp. 5I1]MEB0030860.1 ExbD/TolR family protein [Undibacterium sp. RTI2.1]MEB0117297.1 ExbD/TolR family protein [Undibacterium sp. RTI2.2]MEB0232195.1 ExbD/TolR family protein [Undibacterium sp. 10I3]MEB0257772.1 ExbD/TolR family protein [Undibacterium sp. 5I1]
MSSLRGERKRKFKAEINVVPYIDVMLVLLIIFMVAAPMTNPSVINLPTAGQSTQPPSEYIEVTLDTNKYVISINTKGANGKTGNGNNQQEAKETAANRAQLMQKLSEYHTAKPDLAVLVSADKEMKYDEIIQVISEAKKLGINRVGLATK